MKRGHCEVWEVRGHLGAWYSGIKGVRLYSYLNASLDTHQGSGWVHLLPV